MSSATGRLVSIVHAGYGGGQPKAGSSYPPRTSAQPLGIMNQSP